MYEDFILSVDVRLKRRKRTPLPSEGNYLLQVILQVITCEYQNHLWNHFQNAGVWPPCLVILVRWV